MNQEKIGKFILKLRKDNNLSQSQFADFLNVTSQAVSKWENGRGIPDIEILKKISDQFNVDIDEIISGEKRKKKNNYRPYLITIIILFFIIIVICIYLCKKNDKVIDIESISTEKDKFNVTGILVSNNNKLTIYISNIIYNDIYNEKKFKSIECTLYEEINDTQKILSKYGDIEKESDNYYSLDEFLKDVNFDVENYNDSCPIFEQHNFYITINAMDETDNVIVYKIPLKLKSNCNK